MPFPRPMTWLENYSVKDMLAADVIAGTTVGIMHVPQGMAYAMLAGLPPVHGLYTSFLASLLYPLFGTSPHVSVGVEALVCLMLGGVRHRFVPSTVLHTTTTVNGTDAKGAEELAAAIASENTDAVQVVTSATLIIGVLLITLSLAKLGSLWLHVPTQLIGGFTAGAAVIVLTTQIGPMLGLQIKPHEGPLKLYYIYHHLLRHLTLVNPATLILSSASVTTILFTKCGLNDSPRFRKYLPIPVPIDLLAITLSIAFSYTYNLPGRFNIIVVHGTPTGLPPFSLPNMQLLPSLFFEALPIVVVLACLTLALTKRFAERHKYDADLNQELFSCGLICIINSFFSGMAPAASICRSSVQESIGAKTQAACYAASSVVLVALLWLGPVFEHLPKCILSAIIVVALKGMLMQLGDLKQLWCTNKLDFAVFLSSFLATIILDVFYGLITSILLAKLLLKIMSRFSEPILEKSRDNVAQSTLPLVHQVIKSPVFA